MSGADPSASWLAAEVALAGGLLVGAVGCALGLRRAPPAAPLGADAALDLEERLGASISQLRDLDEQQHRLDAADYRAQRAEFEGRAAGLLRARRALAAAPRRRRDEPLSPTMAYLARRPALRGALWGGGTVGVLALLLALVIGAERPVPAAPAPAAAAADSGEVQRLTQQLQQRPDDVGLLVHLAHALMRGQMLEEARTVNARALRLQPDNLEAQVHAAVFVAAQGDGAAGIAALEAVLARDPKMSEGWFFRGMLSMQANNQPVMWDSFRKFVATAPDGPQKERVRAMLEQQGGGP